MATINFRVKGTKSPATIYVRFRDGNSFDLEAKTGLLINPAFWDKAKQRIRNVIDVPNRIEINENISKLSIFILDAYNSDFITGEVIDKNWIEKVIAKFHTRPETNEKGKVDETKTYLSSFAQDWINNKSKTFKVSANKFMDERTIGHYQQVLDNFIEFEGKQKVKLKDVTNDVLDAFSIFLSDKKGYSETTSKRKIGRIKFFCARAESENLSINKQFKERVFVKEREIEYKEPYLNEDEINDIFNYKLELDSPMDNVRDNLIIGLWTGLRISDFLTRLKTDNIDDGFIKIKTMKTKTYVNIPIHPQVAHILNKRNGKLPKKIAEQKFNNHIKILARLVDIDVEMIGGVVKVDPKTKVKRKVIGVYKKWELITSHICRRSFCTNLAPIIPEKVMMDIMGWKTTEQIRKYNKQTLMESALVLQKHWEEKYKI